jgi:hypothetical protein
MVQYFKSDSIELKMNSVVDPLFQAIDAGLDEFYSDGFDSNPFLLMLYDEERVPFSNRVPRVAFVDFIKQALINIQFTGTFETYLLILKSIFGDDSEIRFYVPSPGIIQIEVEAVTNSGFGVLVREIVDGSYVFYDLIDSDGDEFIFRGVIGIESEYELNLLFNEIIPAGLSPDISLAFFVISDFVDDDDSFVIDDNDMGIIFVEGNA